MRALERLVAALWEGGPSRLAADDGGDEPASAVLDSAGDASSTPPEGRMASRASPLGTVGVLVALTAFSASFVVVDQGYVRFVDARFPAVGTSAWLATLYGLVSRLHLIIPLLILALWRPRLLGFQVGRIRRHWRLLLAFLVANCGIVAGYLVLSGTGTPYSGNQWLITEVVTVPLVEETMWRGAVFAALVRALRHAQPGRAATTFAIWSSGVAFGLLHAGNALVGVPVMFVAVQVLNATIWGVMYGYARARTDSLHPPIALHALMNLVVVLL